MENPFECDNEFCPLKATGTKAPKLMQCSRCLAVNYCSVACQKQHFKQHREDCAMFVELFTSSTGLFEDLHADMPDECKPTSFNHSRLLVCLGGNKGKGSVTAVKQCLASMTPSELTKFFHSKANCGNPPWPHLMRACTFGKFEVVHELIKYGADVNEIEAAGGGCPLMCGVKEGRVDVVKLLLNKGANVNQRVHNGSSALQCTLCPGTRNGQMGSGSDDTLMRIVELLVEGGVDVNVHTVPEEGAGRSGTKRGVEKGTKGGNAASDIAEGGKKAEKKKKEGSRAKPGEKMEGKSEGEGDDDVGGAYAPTALHHALCTHKIDIALYLLAHGALVRDDWIAPHHPTALMWLAMHGQETPSSLTLFDQVLRTGGCDLGRRRHGPGCGGMTTWLHCFHPQHGAQSAPLPVSLGYARLLYATGLVDVNDADDDGYTALHFAALHADHAAVLYLLSLPAINPRLTLRRRREVEGGKPDTCTPYVVAAMTRLRLKQLGKAYGEGIQQCIAIINLLMQWEVRCQDPGWVCPIPGVQWFQKPMSEWVETDGLG